MVHTKYSPEARATWQGRTSSGERALVAFACANPTGESTAFGTTLVKPYTPPPKFLLSRLLLQYSRYPYAKQTKMAALLFDYPTSSAT